jgi:negative regulator of sigma E activity
VTFTTSSGRPIAVGRLLAAGGEGEVFAVTSPGHVVFKKYLPIAFSRDPALEQRLRVMAANRPAGWREPSSGHVTLAWPTEVVLENRRFAGFLMPAVDMNSTVEVHRLTNPSDRKHATGTTSWAQKFTWKYLVYAAANLARATEGLHDVGVVIGDFNERNVRVTLDASVTLLDCDSMQVTDPSTGKRLFCRVGRPEFTPPELLNADWSKTVRHPSSDLFALAIHIYQLLLEGEHPFRGVWAGPGDKPSVSELAQRGDWAHKASGLLKPRPSAIPITLLPSAIVEMFRKAFEDGAANPAARPSAADWELALGNLANSLQECTADSEHFYPGTLNACPWCIRNKRAATQQQSLAPLTRPINAGPVTAVPAQFYGSPYQTPTTARPPFQVPAANTTRVTRTRHPVRTLAVLAVIGLVVSLAVRAAVAGSHASSTGTDTPATATSTLAGQSEASSADADTQATQVDGLLQASKATRTALSNAYNMVLDCSDVADGLSGLEQVASQRNSQITQAQALQTGDLANGAELQSELVQFLQDSLTADNSFVTWAQDESSNCTSAQNDNAYNSGMAESATAVADKNSFLSVWNPIAQNQGLATMSQADL